MGNFVWRTSLFLIAFSVCTPGTVLAQAYPIKSVRIVVPFLAGGGLDQVVRIVGQRLSEELKQPFIIDNRPGAGGIIGTEIVARAAADGYTLVSGTIGTHAINAGLYRKLPYDPVKDFAPVTQLTSSPLVLVVRPSFPATTVNELIALAKSKPDSLTFASAGNGTPPHLAAELFKMVAAVEMLHVPYKGSPAAVVDLLGGSISIYFDAIGSSLPHINSGKLRALAVTAHARSPALPEVPTMIEVGFPGFEVTNWYGLMAPAGTPPAVLSLLQSETAKILKQTEMLQALAAQGADPVGSSREDFARFIRAEIEKWGKVIRSSGMRVD